MERGREYQRDTLSFREELLTFLHHSSAADYPLVTVSFEQMRELLSNES